MDGPQTRRQCPQLNAFYAAAFDERDRILEVVVSILSAVRREDATWRHRLAVNGFDNAHFIGADLDQRHFAYDFLKRKLDQVQAGLQNVSLNTDFAFGRHYSSRGHSCTDVPSFFDRDFACANVHEILPRDGEQDQENNEAED